MQSIKCTSLLSKNQSPYLILSNKQNIIGQWSWICVNYKLTVPCQKSWYGHITFYHKYHTKIANYHYRYLPCFKIRRWEGTESWPLTLIPTTLYSEPLETWTRLRFSTSQFRVFTVLQNLLHKGHLENQLQSLQKHNMSLHLYYDAHKQNARLRNEILQLTQNYYFLSHTCTSLTIFST